MARKAIALALAALACAAPIAEARSAADKRLVKSFLRSHHGYKVTQLRKSQNVPKGWVAVYWLKKQKKAYTAAGAAYYRGGKRMKKPPVGVARALHPTPLYALQSTGTGSYSRVVTTTDPDDPTVDSFEDHQSFNWKNVYGTTAKTLAFELDTTGEGFAANRGSPGITGTGHHREVANDGTIDCDYTLQEDVGRTELSTFPGVSGKSYSITESFAAPDPKPADPQNSCGIAPGDPQKPEKANLADLKKIITFKPPREFKSAFRSWFKPFTLHPAIDSKKHTEQTDPSTGVKTVTDEALTMNGTWTFTLVGLTTTP